MDSKDSAGSTPLHMAATYGQTAAVNTLLRLGANPKVQDIDGHTPYDLAVANEQTEAANMLSAGK